MKIAGLILLFSAITCFAPPPGGSGGRRISSGNLNPPAPPSFPSSGLVHYWTLNESSGSSRLDSVGSLTLSEDAGAVSSATGINGNAADFRSDPSKVLATAATYSFSGAVSINCFFKATSVTGGPLGHFICGEFPDPGELMLWIGEAGAVGVEGNGRFFTGSVATVDVWHMLTLTFDGTTTSAYLDGSVYNSSDGTVADTFTKFSIGDSADYGGDAIDGLVDEIGIWDRGLSSQEVSDLWNGGTGRFP